MLKYQGAVFWLSESIPFHLHALGKAPAVNVSSLKTPPEWMKENKEKLAPCLYSGSLYLWTFFLRQGTIELFFVPLRLGYSLQCTQKTATCFLLLKDLGCWIAVRLAFILLHVLRELKVQFDISGEKNPKTSLSNVSFFHAPRMAFFPSSFF